jgi:hypothetical protein
MAASPVELRVGRRFQARGDCWEVVGVGARVLTVKRLGDGAVMTIATHEFVGASDFDTLGDDRQKAGGDPGGLGALLDIIPEAELTRARAKLEDLLEALTGFRSGDRFQAVDGEPRAPYDVTLVPLIRDRFAHKHEEMRRRRGGPTASVRTLFSWKEAWEAEGLLGLCDKRYRTLRDPASSVAPEFLRALDDVLEEHVNLSTVQAKKLRSDVHHLLRTRFPDRPLVSAREAAGQENAIAIPGRSLFYELFKVRTAKTHALGEAKRRRSNANRPKPTMEPIRATRPGEVVQVDTTVADVLCIDPITGGLCRPEIAGAVCAFDRGVRAIRAKAFSSRGVDAAFLLHDIVVPEPWQAHWPEDALWNYHGVPRHLVVDVFGPELNGASPAARPFGQPGTVVVDRAKIFISRAFQEASRELKLSVQPAPPYTPTFKAVVERWFATVNSDLLQHVRGYTGRSVWGRGEGIEADAVLFVDELRDLLMDWVVSVYQVRPHDGCRLPGAPHITVSPNQMFEEGIARAGFVMALPRPDIAIRLLPATWRTIQHYGINIDGLLYYGEVLENWKRRESPWPREPRRHPFHADPRDLSKVWFWDPDDERWHALRRSNAFDPDMPFNDAALARAKRILLEGGRSAQDPDQLNAALEELLDRRLRGPARTRTELRMVSKAIREADQAQLDLRTARRRLRTRTGAAPEHEAHDCDDEPAVHDPVPVPEAGARTPDVVDAEQLYDLDLHDDEWAEPLEKLE